MLGGGGSVANAGLVIHDSIGKYVLLLNHWCQFGCHGKAWVSVCVRDCRQTSRVPVGPSDWSQKCDASEDAPDEIASCLSRGLGLEMLARTDMF